jgi:hypothetical protein
VRGLLFGVTRHNLATLGGVAFLMAAIGNRRGLGTRGAGSAD